jgi:hypothetical protein
MKQIYWNKQGKHQKWVDEIDETMPTIGYTNNKSMNVFIAMSRIYYDIYNNGGWNIKDGCYKDTPKLIQKFIGKFNSRTAIYDLDYLENKANEVFEKLMEKDLSFESYGLWNNWKDQNISMSEQSGEGWSYITCGTKEKLEEVIEQRKSWGFTVV